MLVDDEILVRSGIRCLIEKLEGFTVVDEAANSGEALEKLVTSAPDIICVDISAEFNNGLNLIRILKQMHPTIAVVAISMDIDEQFVTDALAAGASAYLLKDSAPAELETALRSVSNKGSYLSPIVSTRMIRRLTDRPETSQHLLQSLTARQLQVLKMICDHKGNKQIAHELNLSSKTIAAHRTKIMARVGVRDLLGLVIFANKCGLIAGV